MRCARSVSAHRARTPGWRSDMPPGSHTGVTCFIAPRSDDAQCCHQQGAQRAGIWSRATWRGQPRRPSALGETLQPRGGGAGVAGRRGPPPGQDTQAKAEAKASRSASRRPSQPIGHVAFGDAGGGEPCLHRPTRGVAHSHAGRRSQCPSPSTRRVRRFPNVGTIVGINVAMGLITSKYQCLG